MSEPTAQRTLVKSPPELWAEVSDVECLAKHLGEFGDIRITRLEPETTVVWEGERASGTVELEPSGWGTKVTLKAQAKAAAPSPDPQGDVPSHSETLCRPQAEELPVAAEPEPVAAEPEPVAAEPEPVAPAQLSANELLARSGFFSRMFRRRPEPAAGLTPVPDPPPEEPEPAGDPEPDPLPEPTPLPEPPPEEPPPAATAAPEPIAEPEPVSVPAFDVEPILVGMLDTLGSAHHRPFSR